MCSISNQYLQIFPMKTNSIAMILILNLHTLVSKKKKKKQIIS